MHGVKDTDYKETAIPIHFYSADKTGYGFAKVFQSIINEFPAAHALGWRFAERNFKAKYRQSVLGIFWSFLPPIATSILWIVLNKTNVVNFGNTGVPYPIFVLTGTILWSVFTNSLLMPMQSMQANKGILVKINFPRESILINAFYEVLFNLGFSITVIIFGMIFFHIPLSLHTFLFLPALLSLVLFGMSVGLLLLPLSVLYKDIQFMIPLLLQLGFYLTPVIYPRPVYSGMATILKYNPVTPLLTNARSWLLGLHDALPLWQIAAVTFVAFLLLLVGIFIQRIVIEILIERMGT